MGGVIAIATAASFAVAGKIVGWIIGGSLGGVIGFVSLVIAVPVMPILGMPVAGGSGRLMIAIGTSAVIWWLLGQSVAGRVTRKPVAGWREWAREFLVVGSGIWAGALGGLLLAAFVLGAF